MLEADRLARRLLARIKVEGDKGCWRWLGSTDRRGVGRIKVRGRPRHVYRVAYELLVGPLSDGMDLGRIEECPNRWCCNPYHREPMTRLELLTRSGSITAVNAARTECPRGHPYDERNTLYISTRTGVGRACKACRRARGQARKEAAVG